MAALMVFATPFGDNMSKSFITLIKGQSKELNHAYSEEQIEENRNYMEQLFDATYMQQGGLYKHNDASQYTYSWAELKALNLLVIENGIVNSTNQKQKLEGDLILDDSITKVNTSAFSSCNEMILIRIGFGTTNIAINAFENCANLETFISGINVREISTSAFRGCVKLKNVYFNENIKHIGANTFANCPLLKTIYYNGTTEQWNSITKDDGALGSVTKIICSNGTIEI